MCGCPTRWNLNPTRCRNRPGRPNCHWEELQRHRVHNHRPAYSRRQAHTRCRGVHSHRQDKMGGNSRSRRH